MSSVDVVIPVYNEEQTLARCISILGDYLEKNISQPWRIVIADNGSVDGTLRVAGEMVEKYPYVSCVKL